MPGSQPWGKGLWVSLGWAGTGHPHSASMVEGRAASGQAELAREPREGRLATEALAPLQIPSFQTSLIWRKCAHREHQEGHKRLKEAMGGMRTTN